MQKRSKKWYEIVSMFHSLLSVINLLALISCEGCIMYSLSITYPPGRGGGGHYLLPHQGGEGEVIFYSPGRGVGGHYLFPPPGREWGGHYRPPREGWRGNNLPIITCLWAAKNKSRWLWHKKLLQLYRRREGGGHFSKSTNFFLFFYCKI